MSGPREKLQKAPPVRCVWRPIGSRGDDVGTDYQPPDGWFVDEVLPAFASNGAGVVFVLRPFAAPQQEEPSDQQNREET